MRNSYRVSRERVDRAVGIHGTNKEAAEAPAKENKSK